MKTTTKLALSSMKSGKTRSLLTGIAIFLTTALLTVISFGCKALIQQQIDSAGETYGEHFGIFSQLSPEQADAVMLHSQFYDTGIQQYAAEGVCKGYRINYYRTDDGMRKLSHFTLDSGEYPKAENELIAQKEFFMVHGLKNPKLGDSITVPIRINGEGTILEQEFSISGFLPSSDSNDLAKQYSAYVSKAFLDRYIPNPDDRLTFMGFKVLNGERLNSSEMAEKIKKLAEGIGIEKSQVSVNEDYLFWSLEPNTEVILPSVCILLIIMFMSALVIYNIFHVSIIQKIREYGRLKALGANQKQLKSIIRTEGLILSAAAAPAGILLGLLILKIWLNAFLKIETTVFSLPLTALVILLTVCTVYLSMRKPMRMAAKTSPVEAIRFETEKKETLRKGKTNVTVKSLTLSSLTLHKKQTITTILTMGLSCILFVVIANVAGNMSAERQAREDIEYGRFRIELDAKLDDKDYPENNLNEIQKQAPFDESFLNRLRSIPGVTEVRTRKLIKAYEKNKNTGVNIYSAISVVTEEEFDWLARNAERGEVDYRNTAAKDGVIYMYDHFLDEEYQIGDTYECEIADGDQTVPFSGPILGSCGHSNDSTITMTEDTFRKLGIKTDMTSILFVDCDEKDEASVKKELENITGTMEHISLNTLENKTKLLDLAISFTKSGCYTFLIILGVIGFMNMANTMITNILTRKREFGIMQAIGMSNRQLNQMLQLEGLVFTVGTLFISMLLGNILGYYAFLLCRENGVIGLFEYHLPLPELGFLTVGILALQGILASTLSKNVKKESLVERIRCE